jgi:parvulin-like peptidyl-prolyl isomerase
MTLRRRALPWIATAALAAALGCNPPPSSSSTDGGGGDARARAGSSHVLARVNGTPITETDVALRLKADSHVKEITPEVRKNALETLIRDELAYQKGVALGLDADPAYADEVARAEAQVAALKRRKMGDLYYAREVAGKIEVSDDEVKKYVQDHAADLGTEFHVMQILRRDRGGVEEAKKELDKGTPFEQVAGAPFKDVVGGSAAWDLGFMRWGQLPHEWRDTVKGMKPGDVSGVLGQKDRFWILKLVDRRHIEVDLAAEKPAIVEMLKGEKGLSRRNEAEAKLREGASIVYGP